MHSLGPQATDGTSGWTHGQQQASKQSQKQARRAGAGQEENERTENQEQIGEDGADEGHGDDGVEPLGEGRDGEDELDHVAKSGVEEATDDVTKAQRQILRHLPQHQRQGHQRDEILWTQKTQICQFHAILLQLFAGRLVQELNPDAASGLVRLIFASMHDRLAFAQFGLDH